MDQKWREYPVDREKLSHPCKMNLRTLMNYAPLLWRGNPPLKYISKQDHGDDKYQMLINEEEVQVVTRERGQRSHEEGIFDNLAEGIFFKVSEENARAAESKLAEIFSK